MNDACAVHLAKSITQAHYKLKGASGVALPALGMALQAASFMVLRDEVKGILFELMVNDLNYAGKLQAEQDLDLLAESRVSLWVPKSLQNVLRCDLQTLLEISYAESLCLTSRNKMADYLPSITVPLRHRISVCLR